MDIIIPYHEKDEYTIRACIDSCKKYVQGFENIYILSKNELDYSDTKWIPETVFPFTIEDIGRLNPKISESRRAWYYQQLLKLYVFKVREDFEEFLILDSDVVFLKEYFPKVEGKWAYNTHSDIHEPYALNAKLIHPSLVPFDEKTSGVTHTMLFERKRLQQLFNRIKRKGQEVWETIISSLSVGFEGGYGSTFSEYDLYFNFIMNEHRTEYTLRKTPYQDVQNYKKYLDRNPKDLVYVANHSYMRGT